MTLSLWTTCSDAFINFPSSRIPDNIHLSAHPGYHYHHHNRINIIITIIIITIIITTIIIIIIIIIIWSYLTAY